MFAAHKIALAVNDREETLLRKHAGYARLAYNCGLADFKDGLDEDCWRTPYELRKRFNALKKERFPWSKELSQNAAKNAFAALGKAIDGWKDKRTRFPKFHSKKRDQSFQIDNGPDTVRVEGKEVILPKIGRLRMREALRFSGSIRTATICCEAERWFVCFAVDTEDIEPHDPTGKPTVGVDVGLKTLAVCSDGQTVENPKPLQAAQRALRRLDKALARSLNTHGRNQHSNRRDRLRKKRQRLHQRIKNLRMDALHKATSQIVRSAAKVVVEDLNVAGMMRNRSLAKALADASLSELLRQLEYKCQWRGVAFEKISRWFPSTKTCSKCGAVKPKMRLSERIYDCGSCGFRADRDWNAARNLADAASCAESKNGRGALVSPPVSTRSARRDEASMEQLSFDFNRNITISVGL